MPQKNSDQLIERRRMRIIEAYKVPTGNVSPDIFKLPCVTSAYKTMTQGIRYHVEYMIAKPSDWICKDENGEWLVLDDEEYQAEKGGGV